MIEIDNLTIRSGPFTLTGINLSIPAGAYAVLMGRTGQGKTTILEAICGLRPVTTGRVILCGRDATRLKPADRNVGYVPQDLALFPTMTVREHLAFALRVRRLGAKIIQQRVDELAHTLHIEPLLPRRITGLSGGEAQRVALGRALSFRPHILLLDEPLTALDETTRNRLCELLRLLAKTHGLTTLHITHSRAEALVMAERLFLLENGKIREQPLSELANAGDLDLPVASSPMIGEALR